MRYMENIPLSQQMILGSMLGDAYFNKQRKIIRFAQGSKQKEYLDYKRSIFTDCNISSIYTRYYPDGNIGYSFEVYKNKEFDELYKFILRHLYANSGRKKISMKYLNKLTPFSLAIWWLDDGSLCMSKGNRWGKLCTECFNYEEHILIQQYFKKIWDIDVKITKEKDKYFYINFNAHALRKLISIIYPYVFEVPSMIYKIDMKYKRSIDLQDFQSVYDAIEEYKINKHLN